MIWYIIIGVVCFVAGIYGGSALTLWTLRKKGLLLDDDDNNETAGADD